MANAFLLTISPRQRNTKGVTTKRVRFTVTVIGDGTNLTGDGDTLKWGGAVDPTTLNAVAIAALPISVGATQSATVITLQHIFGFSTTVDYITALTPLLDSLTTPAVGWIPVVSKTTGLLICLGTSGTVGQLRDSGGTAAAAGTYTAEFAAEGF